jgi:hypothetical protein
VRGMCVCVCVCACVRVCVSCHIPLPWRVCVSASLRSSVCVLIVLVINLIRYVCLSSTQDIFLEEAVRDATQDPEVSSMCVYVWGGVLPPGEWVEARGRVLDGGVGG